VKLNATTARVLIVDDEPDQATVLGKLLKTCGYLVQVVTDSTQCLPHLESFKPDVVLLDIAMPKVSGYELAKQIRAQGESERVAIIAMSGYADREHTQWSIEAGCDHHLVKPVRLAAIEAAIAHEVEKRQALSQ
jgi:two-component system, OmpR family, response regulator